jgi:hypothetical protein
VFWGLKNFQKIKLCRASSTMLIFWGKFNSLKGGVLGVNFGAVFYSFYVRRENRLLIF